jgi:predicted nucleic-acid-binding protein
LIGLDTNILVRHFTHDDARQAPAALRLIDEELGAERPGHISIVVTAELVWVLRSSFGADKDVVVGILGHLLADRRFVVQHREAEWAALDLYKTMPVDFGDSLVAALDCQAGCDLTSSFHPAAARIRGVRQLSLTSAS